MNKAQNNFRQFENIIDGLKQISTVFVTDYFEKKYEIKVDYVLEKSHLKRVTSWKL